MTALQQSSEFERALSAYGTDTALSRVGGPVILRRHFPLIGTVAFASRTEPKDFSDLPVQLLNGETPCPRPYRAAGFRQIITAAHIAEWDLTRDDLRSHLTGKWRNQLVKSERQNLRMRVGLWDGSSHPMFECAEKTARQKRYKSYPTALLICFAKLSPQDALLFEAFDHGTLIGACLVLRHGATATYQTAWSTPTGYERQAPRALLWAAALHLKRHGVDMFDLGTVETEHAAGLARFKLGTGAALRPLGGTWARLRRR